jgi:hypothetical protein
VNSFRVQEADVRDSKEEAAGWSRRPSLMCDNATEGCCYPEPIFRSKARLPHRRTTKSGSATESSSTRTGIPTARNPAPNFLSKFQLHTA